MSRRHDPSKEAKITQLYRLVVQSDEVDIFEVTPGEETRVRLFRELPGPARVSRGTILMLDSTLNEALEYLVK